MDPRVNGEEVTGKSENIRKKPKRVAHKKAHLLGGKSPRDGWDSDTVVDYKINEDEFHKISLLDCDFFIRMPPDPDNDVYDFREDIIQSMPHDAHPMGMLVNSISVLSIFHPDANPALRTGEVHPQSHLSSLTSRSSKDEKRIGSFDNTKRWDKCLGNRS
ncbi:hypothetical protein Fmac_023618 [Flemingia macrophylla]|uniref:Uncharacterized protein n=1 Tax=Flemingia macrophylla TaxID=520843 RepID=A0ABD1LNL9_9FABA